MAGLLVLGAARVAEAGPGAPVDWELTGLTVPVQQLYAPASGAFFAQTVDGLQRSDDGGVTWREVLLPPGGSGGLAIAVDPTNHMAIYAAGQGGLYKTEDDAATWQLVLPTAERIQRIAVSPADAHLVLVRTGLGPYRQQRSV